MSMLHLIRVPIRRRELVQWVGDRGWGRQRGRASFFDSGRALHHLLAEVFGPRILQPFRWLLPPRGAVGNLYAYSMKDAAALQEAARLHAWPEHLSVLDTSRLAGKPMPSDWREGRRIGFDLLVRPVRRMRASAQTPTGAPVGLKKGREVDAYWLKCLREPEAEHNREAVYLDWLSERLGNAAEMDRSTTRMKQHQRTRVWRGEENAEGPDAVFHGTLSVKDPAFFSRLLAVGVGRHRAYGYGMLLLRPPSQAPFRR